MRSIDAAVALRQKGPGFMTQTHLYTSTVYTHISPSIIPNSEITPFGILYKTPKLPFKRSFVVGKVYTLYLPQNR